MEMRIFDFDSGVEMWKMTPSKSETVWSMETGGALRGGLATKVVGRSRFLP